MADRAPPGLWLQPDGCCNGPSWVAVEFTPTSFMFLKRRWKSFALTRGMKKGHVLYFQYDEAATLFMKIFGVTGCHLKCCMESGDNNTSHDDDGDVSPSDGTGSRGGSPTLRARTRTLTRARSTPEPVP